MFLKIMRKMSTYFRSLVEGAVADTLPAERVPVVQDTTDAHDESVDGRFQPLAMGLEDELRQGGEKVNDELREKQKALIDALPLDRYEINNGDESWEDAEKQVRAGGASTVSVKSSKPSSKRKKGESAREIYNEEIDSKKQKMIKKGTEGRKSRS
ncbi:N-acetyltransferase 10 [Elasticomyces elasticus]|nr:N-acetyltransferase 10 [Elasticomyces elasticus]